MDRDALCDEMLCRECRFCVDDGRFFFLCSGHHRDLHSFPTRRSSDLGAPPAPAAGPRSPTSPACGPARRPRSEEHTSELQSQSNLVCRLLLEKKKKKKEKH